MELRRKILLFLRRTNEGREQEFLLLERGCIPTSRVVCEHNIKDRDVGTRRDGSGHAPSSTTPSRAYRPLRWRFHANADPTTISANNANPPNTPPTIAPAGGAPLLPPPPDDAVDADGPALDDEDDEDVDDGETSMRTLLGWRTRSQK